LRAPRDFALRSGGSCIHSSARFCSGSSGRQCQHQRTNAGPRPPHKLAHLFSSGVALDNVAVETNNALFSSAKYSQGVMDPFTEALFVGSFPADSCGSVSTGFRDRLSRWRSVGGVKLAASNCATDWIGDCALVSGRSPFHF
jgi:hypothetical protein